MSALNVVQIYVQEHKIANPGEGIFKKLFRIDDHTPYKSNIYREINLD